MAEFPLHTVQTTPYGRDASAYESITVSTSAVGLAAGTYGDAEMAEITVEDAAIRIRVDGTDPTASEGHLVREDDTILLKTSDQLDNFSAIRNASSDATLRVTYYGG